MSGAVSPHLLLLFLSASVLFSATTATDHIVGDNRGWNPGVNYTLWAGNHTFYVEDLISFRYQKTTYNVYRVNETGYDNCTTEGALGNWSSGKDFILLDKAKRYYFICGNGFCFSGMKVTVLVHSLPPPPAASVSEDHKSGREAVFRRGWAVFRVVLSVMTVSVGWVIGELI
ncbi:early nodulin-like protein 16 [Magnolia sinica]|uniref:early nodulin-like protein 16 n=1 Tax=Magnolia sinica TaxID=86752 RepID=UPI00265B22D0|nr:early nodulin-like protein 16 [Magnolia sinica]